MKLILPLIVFFVGLPVIASRALGQSQLSSARDLTIPELTSEEKIIFADYLSLVLRRSHGPLLNQISHSLGVEAARAVKTALVDRELEMAEISKRAMGQDAADQKQEVKAKFLRTIEVTGGKKLVEIVSKYDESIPHRQVIYGMNQVLMSSNECLSSSQADKVLNYLASNVTASLRIDASDSEMVSYIHSRELNHEQIRKLAQRDLTPIQMIELDRELDTEIAYLKYFRMRREQLARIQMHRTETR